MSYSISLQMTNKNVIIFYQKNMSKHNGMCILDLSKVLMYQFHYDYIKYNNKSKLLFTDTDSLLYKIKAEEIYEDLSSDKKGLILVIIQLSKNTTIIQTN